MKGETLINQENLLIRSRPNLFSVKSESLVNHEDIFEEFHLHITHT